MINQEKNSEFLINNVFDIIWRRIKKETGLKTMQQLGEIIGKKQNTISSAKKRNDFPADWAYLLAKRYGLLTEWIMTGQGPKRLAEAQHIEQPKTEFLRELELWATEVSGKGSLEWLENQLESQFPAWKKWREEKNEANIDKVA